MKIQHTPEDMTVTVESAITLAALQREVASGKQWLPIDPPHPEKISINELLASDLSGPRRFGYGTIRDFVIGLKVILADGHTITSGGKVVKNVAGYDLQKLFIGGRGSLGKIVEVTFKLRPIPEAELFIQKTCDSLQRADETIQAVLDSALTPVVLDLHNMAGGFTIVLGFDGTREEIDWQHGLAKDLGFTESAKLDFDQALRSDAKSLQKLSVLPSTLAAAIQNLPGASFVARAGNGVIYFRGEPVARKEELPVELMRRLKTEFDPRNTLPALPL